MSIEAIPVPHDDEIPYIRAIHIQTEQLQRAVERMGDRIDRGIESLRQESAETRRSLVVVILVAFILMAAAMGVSVSYSGFTASRPSSTSHAH